MTNWTDPVVITRTSRVFAAFTLVLTGVAIWDVLSTLWFDWQIVTGRRKWRWPMLIYMIARISMLMHIFAITINRNALAEVPCSDLTFMSKFCDALGTVCSSLILVLRTRAVWHRDIKVTVIMGVLLLGQIGMWSQTFRFSKAAWNPKRQLCDVLSTAPRPLMVAVWGYTMFFDFVILLLCTYRLSAHRTNTLGGLLLRDGIAYFTFAFGANLIQTIFAGLQFNPVMNIMCLPFALVVSVIAATAVFRNVFTAYDSFSSEGVKHSGGSSGPMGLGGHGGAHPNSGSGGGSGAGGKGLRTGARILFNHNTSTYAGGATTADVTSIPLGDYKGGYSVDSETGDVKSGYGGVGAISVTKVVDVEVDGGRDQTSTWMPEKRP